MSAESIARYLQWFGFLVVGVVVLSAIVQAFMMSQPRRLRVWVLVVVAVIDLVAVLALYWLGNVFLSPWWMLGLLVLGVVAGWFVGRGTKTAEKDGQVYTKLSPVGPWLVAAGLVASVATLFFAPVGAFAFALLFSLFAVGVLLGQGLSAGTAKGPAPQVA